jgi:hypothetical protein
VGWKALEREVSGMEKGELHAGTAKEIYFPAISVLATAGEG